MKRHEYRSKRRRARDERGVAAVEFAIILPLLIVILFAITSFGLAVSTFVTYIAAAREGARLRDVGDASWDAAAWHQVSSGWPSPNAHVIGLTTGTKTPVGLVPARSFAPIIPNSHVSRIGLKRSPTRSEAEPNGFMRVRPPETVPAPTGDVEQWEHPQPTEEGRGSTSSGSWRTSRSWA